MRKRRLRKRAGGTKVVLKQLDPAHQPIVLTPEVEDQVRVIAESVSIVD